MKLEDYIKKIHDVNSFGNLGAISAAAKAATLFEEPSYMKAIKNANNLSGFFKDYTDQQNMLKGLGSISNTLMQSQKLNSFSELAKSASLADKFYKPDHFSFLTNSLKGGLSETFSKVNMLNNFQKRIEIPEIYKDNISKIVSNNNSIFEGLNSLAKTFGSNNLLQTQVLSQYSAATLNATLAESIRNQNWEDVETIENLTEEINDITSEAVASGSMNKTSLEAIEKTLDVILAKINSQETASDRKQFLIKLLNVIAVVGFLIGLIAFYLQVIDHSKEDIMTEIKASEKRIVDKVTATIQELSKKRTAIAKVNLRLKPSKKSPILATLQIGQEVFVISVNHKWLLVSYTDPDSGVLTTGWVYKKYLEKL